MNITDENIVRLKSMASQLVEFADFACQVSKDDRCLLLYGITMDCGYRLLAEAEREWENHTKRDGIVMEGNQDVTDFG